LLGRAATLSEDEVVTETWAIRYADRACLGAKDAHEQRYSEGVAS
jgi:hypothetical protein